jgi:hypothetical protein
MQNIPIFVSPDIFKRSALELSRLRPAPHNLRAGSSGVLITCVHGHRHVRDGWLKSNDSGSIETSHAIALASDSTWLAVGEEGAIDSNYHRDTPFKRYLNEHLDGHDVQLVLDIHVSDALRPYDVEIGSMDQRSWLGNIGWRDNLQRMLVNSGFLVSDNQVFRAFGSRPEVETITSLCVQKGVPAVQLEISSALTDELTTIQARHANAKLVNALAAFAAELRPAL